ncbi:MAG TPA: class I SAM-dependent methyltransferase [Alicycliphilus sp.]|nr:class I SAM-dependent methyltransferase [Alicycliphilus sp.]
MHDQLAPSDWIRRWSHLVPAGGQVLDVACGQGRHMRWFFERNHPVTGLDKVPEAIESVASLGQAICADLEAGPWPLPERRFDCVLVTNYLWRPLLPTLVDSVASGGVLLYETFAQGNETVGRPARAEFLLRPGELLQACQGLRVIAYEDGYVDAPARFVQRIAAVRAPLSPAGPLRLPLVGTS